MSSEHSNDRWNWVVWMFFWEALKSNLSVECWWRYIPVAFSWPGGGSTKKITSRCIVKMFYQNSYAIKSLHQSGSTERCAYSSETAMETHLYLSSLMNISRDTAELYRFCNSLHWFHKPILPSNFVSIVLFMFRRMLAHWEWWHSCDSFHHQHTPKLRSNHTNGELNIRSSRTKYFQSLPWAGIAQPFEVVSWTIHLELAFGGTIVDPARLVQFSLSDSTTRFSSLPFHTVDPYCRRSPGDL